MDRDEDGVINFREFATTLGLICRGNLQERLNLMFLLHLPPALPLYELDISNTKEEDEELDSCAEVDESDDVCEYDGINKTTGDILMDPLGAGVVVIDGKESKQYNSIDDEPSSHYYSFKSKVKSSELVMGDSVNDSSELKNSKKFWEISENFEDILTHDSETSMDGANTKDFDTSFPNHTKPTHEDLTIHSEMKNLNLESGKDFSINDDVCKGSTGVYHVVEGSTSSCGDECEIISKDDVDEEKTMNQVS